MRVFLTLESLKDYAYDRQYYHKLQGFVFSLLKHSEYAHLHDLPGWKPLCFSNIFPMTGNTTGARKHLLLSSPHPGVAEALLGQAEALAGKDIHIGEMSFRVTGARLLRPRLEPGMRLITATPIVLRIPDYNYVRYGISSQRTYEYWRPALPFEVFVRQLEENLLKRYQTFIKREVEEEPVFDQFVFKSRETVELVIDGKAYRMPATYWEFPVSHLSPERRAVLQFALDAGLGERTTFGLGFVNSVGGQHGQQEQSQA